MQMGFFQLNSYPNVRDSLSPHDVTDHFRVLIHPECYSKLTNTFTPGC